MKYITDSISLSLFRESFEDKFFYLPGIFKGELRSQMKLGLNEISYLY